MAEPQKRDLFYGTSGPQDAEIVIVGESWGAEEAKEQKPFIGMSGIELNRLLAEAGIDRNSVLCTNVVAERPQNNETFRFFLPKNSHPNARRVAGLICSDHVAAEVKRLYRQLAHRPRSLVIAAGNWSLWALSKVTGARILREANGRRIPEELQTFAPNGIMSYRGSMLLTDPHLEFDPPAEARWVPLLPIIHPAAIMREWYLRSPTLHDLKSRVPKALNNDWAPRTPVTFSPPTWLEAVEVLESWLSHAEKEPFDLANDIETVRRTFITCIGFANSPHLAICIPFIRGVNSDGSFESYWSTDEEATLVELIRKVLSHPNIRIIGQNYIYDTQFIQHWLGVTPRLSHDTMLAQNVLFPGTPKDLSYLSSLYCEHHSYWKDDVKDWNTIDHLQSLLDYNCVDNMRTWEIAQAQKLYAKNIGQEEQVAFKMQTSRLCLRMMNRGIKFDTARAGSMLYELQAALQGFYAELLHIVPQALVKPHTGKKTDTFWFKSPKQTAELFYDILNMQVVNDRKTGNRTVGKEALMVLQRKYPEFTHLFQRLDYAGSVANTVNVVKSAIEPDGRMRCSYNPGGTETHRLSSSENVFGRGTNLQNLTKGEEDD